MYLIRKFSKFSTAHLDKLQFSVTQLKATEPAFSSDFNKNDLKGTYSCVVCSEPLFSSTDKFDSGSGWPSFSSSLTTESLKKTEDFSFNMQRTEVACAVCHSHLGHFFLDGPKGRRYCINGCALKFDKIK